MNRILVAIAVILTYSLAGWSQNYYEASGQTPIFSLKANAKYGPQSTDAHRGGSVICAGTSSAISIASLNGAIVITPHGVRRSNIEIALYDIKGRQIYRHGWKIGTSLRLETRMFAAGVYSLLVRVDDQNYARMIAINGWGQ